MSDPSENNSSPEATAALPPMALLATLQTARAVGDGIRERRAGRDPAAQEPAEDARAYLTAAAGELTRLHMQLLMAKVQATRCLEKDGADENARADDAPAALPPAHLAASVRQFDMLMKLRRAGRLLHGAHQRLMSLYPGVSEELVEEARRCQGALAELRGARRPSGEKEDCGEPLALFLQRLVGFAAWMRREL